MTDRGKHYCDRCWALILDRGYVDDGELCEQCFARDVAGVELDDDRALDVVLVERLIV